ncbi:F-box only protein 5 isoform X2 [Ambystoma mexicanum]
MKCHLSNVATRQSPKKQEPPADTKLEDFCTQDYEDALYASSMKDHRTSCTDLSTLCGRDCQPKQDKENKNLTPLRDDNVRTSLDLEHSEIQDESGYSSMVNSNLTDTLDSGLFTDVSLGDTPIRLQSQTPPPFSKYNLPIVCFEEVVCSTLKKTSRRNPKLDWDVVEMVSKKGFGLQNVIGRKMGLDRMDILGELFLRDFRHVVAQILVHLSEMDLINVAGVSRRWNDLLTADKRAFPLYISSLEAFVANTAKLSEDVASRTYSLRRAALTSVQKAASPNCKPSKKSHRQKQASYGSIQQSRHAEFAEAVKTLKNDESLKVCLHCRSPAKFDSYTHRATCSRQSCGFDFCTQCLCDYHFSKDCASSKSPMSGIRLGPLPGSKQSKQNLRRL